VRLRAPTFKRRHIIVAAATALVVVVGGGTWAATRSPSDAAAPTLVSATSSTIRDSVSASGTIQPAQRADLSFAVSGTVISLPVAAGDQVKAGTTLATVDSASLQSAVTSAQATVTATQDQLTAQQSAASSAVQIASTQAQLADVQGKLTDARTALAAASMTSPIAGTVAQVNIAIGDKVGSTASSASAGSGGTSSGGTGSSSSSAGASSSSSTAQIVVISTTSWVVQASVGSADLPKLKKGMQAEVTPTGSATKIFGTVKSIGIVASSSSSGSASFPVTIIVTGSPKGLYAGGAADVSIIVKRVENLLTVPTNALHTEGGKTVVHQLRNGAQVSTAVKVGTTYGPVTQILSGLKAGDKVVGTAFRVGGTGGTRSRTGSGTGGGGGGGGYGGGGFSGGGGGYSGPPPGAGGANG
jgi:macrolide-specific efflux system membrane fusion protein